MKKLLLVTSLSIFVYSCKKNNEVREKSLQQVSQHYSIHDYSEPISGVIGKGYSSIEKNIKNKCLENVAYEFIPSGKSQVSFHNNLTVDELNDKLDMNVNGKLHSIQGDITLDTSFLNNLLTSDSSSTFTLIANVTNGKNRLKKSNENSYGFKIADFYKKIFDKNQAEFIKVCGDEVIESQKLSAFLIITARLDFKNKSSKEKFESTIGADKNIFEEISMNINSSLNKLDENARKSIKVTITGTQLGGDFRQLQSILKKNVCNLAQIQQCSQIFETINEYFSNEFNNQLDANNENVWVSSQLKSIPYSKIIILDDNNSYFSEKFNYGMDYLKVSNKLSDLKEINSKIYGNTHAALNSDKSKNFTADELHYYKINNKNSKNNINIIDDFLSECKNKKGIEQCVSTLENFMQQYFAQTDESLTALELDNHIITYNNGIEEHYINNVRLNKKTIDPYIFSSQNKIKFILVNNKNYEVNDQIIEIHCQKDYQKKLAETNKTIWFSSFLNIWPSLVTLIHKAVHNEYALLDVIWNRKESDLSLTHIHETCGKNMPVFILSEPFTSIDKIITRSKES